MAPLPKAVSCTLPAQKDLWRIHRLSISLRLRPHESRKKIAQECCADPSWQNDTRARERKCLLLSQMFT